MGCFFDAEGGYQCWPKHPDRVRKPDISFAQKNKLKNGSPPEGWLRVPPDFVVEILSKNETLREVEEKVAEYLEVGVPLIWVVNPKRKVIRVYRGSMIPLVVKEGDIITGNEVLPGFECRVSELFSV